jgi:2-amino-4-hydroxy-6-hydroxymethyldihydropteridine diphosphokinase
VDFEDQDWFVNAAVKIETKLSPRGLLEAIQEIQTRRGRKPNTVRFGPRALDLDIIFYDAVVMNAEGLKIPHPRMHKRRFVLQPICDIDPSIMHPILQKDMRTLLNELKDSAQVIEEIQ